MTSFSWHQLARAVESEVAEEITSRTHDRWNGQENSITDAIIGRLRSILAQAQIVGEREKVAIDARLFKARGKVETRFGDLAVIVNLRFWDNSTLQGVAFYEAKRRAWKGTKLESAGVQQLRRIDNNLWNAHLLVYDREPILSAPLEAIASGWPEDHSFWDSTAVSHDVLPFTHAAVVRLQTALAYAELKSSLYKLSLPFALQLCSRNLQGLDLDHDPEVLKGVKGQSEKYDVPRTVLSVSVSQGPGTEPVTPVGLSEARFNELTNRNR